MDELKLSKALKLLMPLGGYSTVEGTVVINDDGIAHGYTLPSDAEIVSAILQVDAQQYKEQRAVEYPPIGDQLDAIHKGGQSHADMKVIISAVKTKYPKPNKQ